MSDQYVVLLAIIFLVTSVCGYIIFHIFVVDSDSKTDEEDNKRRIEKEILEEYLRKRKAKESEQSEKIKNRESKSRADEDNQRSNQSTPRQKSSGEELRYGTILGLKGRVTMSDVKMRYRELVSQYHPDKVNHLGEKLKQVAELEMKDINEAYEYFKRKYE
jgi:preprotein translocase subunit Sec63